MDKPLIVRPLDCCKGSDMLTDGADCNISMSVQISARCVPGLASPICRGLGCCCVPAETETCTRRLCRVLLCQRFRGCGALVWHGILKSKRREGGTGNTFARKAECFTGGLCAPSHHHICQCLRRCTSLALQAHILAERREMGCGRGGSWHRNLPIF